MRYKTSWAYLSQFCFPKLKRSKRRKTKLRNASADTNIKQDNRLLNNFQRKCKHANAPHPHHAHIWVWCVYEDIYVYGYDCLINYCRVSVVVFREYFLWPSFSGSKAAKGPRCHTDASDIECFMFNIYLSVTTHRFKCCR